jgi:hypothetical protein
LSDASLDTVAERMRLPTRRGAAPAPPPGLPGIAESKK